MLKLEKELGDDQSKLVVLKVSPFGIVNLKIKPTVYQITIDDTSNAQILKLDYSSTD